MSDATAGGETWLMRTPPLEAVTCLFFFALFLVVFVRHLYVTGFLGRRRLAHLAQEAEARAEARGRLNARIRAFIDLVTDSAYARAAAAAAAQQHHHRRGLDSASFKSLPAIAFRPEDYKAGVECAVCLGELAAGEAVRQLPECSHVFHAECIDMWFFSHSTCPLCRSPVLPEPWSLAPPADLLPPLAFARATESSSSPSSSSSSPSRTAESVAIDVVTPAAPLPEGVHSLEKDVERPSAAEGSGSSPEGDIEEGIFAARTSSTAQGRS